MNRNNKFISASAAVLLLWATIPCQRAAAQNWPIQYPELTTPASGDALVVLDVSDTTKKAYGTTKHVLWSTFTDTFSLKFANSASLFALISDPNGTGELVFNTSPTIVGTLGVNNGAIGSGVIKIFEDTDNGGNFTSFQVPALAGDVAYTLPPALGGAGTVLTDAAGDGTLSWAAGGGGSGDVATDTIWNAAGDLAVGTGVDTATVLPKGTALQALRVNAGGTALEWAATFPPDPGADSYLVWNNGAGAYDHRTIAGTTTYDLIMYALTPGTNPALAGGNQFFGLDGIVFEGTTANAFEGVLLGGDPTADWTWTLPNADTTIPIASQQITWAGPTTARTYTLPDAASTLVSLTAVQTLSSKTLSAPAIDSAIFNQTTAIVAGTDAQGQGALTTDVNYVATTAANPSGVTLPAAAAGRFVSVHNRGTNPINIYPSSGYTIGTLAVDLPILIRVGDSISFRARTTSAWQIFGYKSFGLTTQMPVGGGANALPVWTTVTGTTSPVLSNSPTITSPTISTSISLPADAVDAITEVATGIKTGNAVKLVTAASVSADELMMGDVSGNLVSSGLSWDSMADIGNGLGQFASSTSASLRTVLSDETGTGILDFRKVPQALPASPATLAINSHYYDYALGAAVTWTLPSAPAAGSTIDIDVRNAAATTVTFGGTGDQLPYQYGTDGKPATMILPSSGDTAHAIKARYVGGEWHIADTSVSNEAAYSIYGNFTGAPATPTFTATTNTPANGEVLSWNTGGTLTWIPASGSGDMILADNQTVTGIKTFGSPGAVGRLLIAGATSGSTAIYAQDVAGATSVTLPAGSPAVLATVDTAETITGVKSFVSGRLSIQGDSAFYNTLQGSDSGGGGTTKLPPGTSTLASLDGVETLTNKTLTTPDIGVATGTGLTLTGDLAVNGGDITTTGPSLVIRPADAGVVSFTDGTNTLATITDSGTTGDLHATGKLTVQGTTNKLPAYTEVISANHTLTAAECWGAIYYVDAACTPKLPPVQDGMSVTFITIGAFAVSVDPDDGDGIRLDGSAMDTDGDAIANTTTAGDICVISSYPGGLGWHASTNGWTAN